jgi:hypothetical protein
MHTGFGGGGNLREGDHLKDLSVDERIILKWLFEKLERRAWTGYIWLRIGAGGDEPSDSIKFGEFLDWLRA